MRVFKIPHTRIWVDLDHVQEIEEPALTNEHATPTVRLRYRLAFVEKPRELLWDQPEDWSDDSKSFEMAKTPAGEPTELARVRDEVFAPFFAAWKGTS